jgi:glycosidase
MSKLQELLDILDQQVLATASQIFNYTVPDLWNCFDYQGEELRKTPWGELVVNPYRFYRDAIQDFVLPRGEGAEGWGRPLSRQQAAPEGLEGGDWIKRSVVYSMMVRTSTAWDHDRSGSLEDENLYGLKETGTFVKSIAHLSLLHKMGVTCVYLLPISKFSLKDKKGELGSPYGVSSFFTLDPNLKDPMTGPAFTVEDEFRAFVEACHILGMHVMIDIIPRTNSVASELILEHPDWFYWIRHEALATYRPPYVPGLGVQIRPKPEFLPVIYQSPEVRHHLASFVVNPRAADPERWAALERSQAAQPGRNVLEAVQEQFGLTVAPAFSDQVNDPQPAWNDVTFFRMYLDHPTASVPFLDRDYAPYILFDVIKANLYQGKVKNAPLWDLLSGIIPYYQEHFGIDGARIDMGHALPRELVERIIGGARTVDAEFCFIAEEMELERAASSKEAGYNMILGDGFLQEPRVLEFKTHHYMYEARNLPCPVYACGETHDTPRLAAREGGRALARMLTIMNLFMPNGVPFINSGQEVYELQPMNTGVDCRPNEALQLDPRDPYYGRLALFDRFAFHYLNAGRWELPDQLAWLAGLRRDHLATFTRLENSVPLGFNSPRDPGIAFGFIDDDKRGAMVAEGNVFVVVANTDVHNPQYLTVHLEALRQASGNAARKGVQLFSSHGLTRDVHDFDPHWNLSMSFQPGEVKIIRM